MIFPSYIFVLVFLPCVLAGWYGLRSVRLRLGFLTVCSYIFYGWWDYRFVVLMLATTLLDYFVGRAISLTDNVEARRRYLALSVAGNLASLGFFKYFNFFSESLAELLGGLGLEANVPMLHVVLPIGISFYTFQSMSYSIDIYRGKCKPTGDLLSFLAYVSMFPQLVAGPIVRYDFVEGQLRNLGRQPASLDGISDGVWLFVVGLVKKIWIADALSPVVALAFDGGSAPAFYTAWAGTVCYTFQLYFDFSAYSDMARGLGGMLGFAFPVNFDSPYKAGNIAEFWRRWHITLSEWLRDYLFIPLGGSRGSMVKTLRNLGMVMFLGGLWHGAAWNFVAWGLLHGLLLIVYATWKRVGPVTLPRPVGVAVTFFCVMIGWAVFRADSLGGALEVLAGLAGLHGFEPLTYYSTTFGLNLPALYGTTGGAHGLAFLTLVALVAFLAPNSQQLPKPRHPAFGVACGLIVLCAVTTFMDEAPFLYFEF
ncbi:MAG: MBOAT family O-acyltransferase [Phycisphaerae bacterium]